MSSFCTCRLFCPTNCLHQGGARVIGTKYYSDVGGPPRGHRLGGVKISKVLPRVAGVQHLPSRHPRRGGAEPGGGVRGRDARGLQEPV